MKQQHLIGVAGLIVALSLPTCAQPPADTGRVVATGQVVRPAGKIVAFPGHPVDLCLSPDRSTAYLKDDHGIVVVDLRSWRVRQTLPFTSGGGSMHGIATSVKGDRVYATNMWNLLAEAKVGEDGSLTWNRQITLPASDGGGNSNGCGIALTADGARAYVCLSRNNTLAVVDLAAGKVTSQIPVGVAPYDVVLSQDGRTAFVSDWGGRHPRPGEPQAPSSGTPALIDTRGIGASGCVSMVDLVLNRVVAQIHTGLHPSDIELSHDGRRLFVANANSDTVSVIDTRLRHVVETITVRPHGWTGAGSAPTGLALSPDNTTLFVTLGGSNAIAVVDVTGTHNKARVKGFIPAGWYPGAVVTDGREVFVANVKGNGSEDRGDAKGFNVRQVLGGIQRAPVSAWLDTTTPESRRKWDLSGRIDHVVYILKENRTYDQILGDIARGNGDPALCIYGRNVTPNEHALAEQFVLLDNYYCNGVVSADGHSWATEGNDTDHLEKSFGGFARSYTFGDDPLTYSSSGFIWNDVLAHGRTFRNYGEMDYAGAPPKSTYSSLLAASQAHNFPTGFTHNIGIASLKPYTDPDYPGWDMDIPDAVRADLFLRKFAENEKSGAFPNFVLIYLPDDHTWGTGSSQPTPRSYVADNDLAVGRIVDAISHSRFWKNTCIFVNEDDPSDGFDHVDGHRSICLVVSPYSKHGKTVHQWCNQTSALHTMEALLGIPTMNQMDANSPVMTDCFTAKLDFTPYRCVPNKVPLGEMNPKASTLTGRRRYWAMVSDRLDMSGPDNNPDAVVNQILWFDAKGANAPYPSESDGGND
jgi:YVTN family beta-propeller protein